MVNGEIPRLAKMLRPLFKNPRLWQNIPDIKTKKDLQINGDSSQFKYFKINFKFFLPFATPHNIYFKTSCKHLPGHFQSPSLQTTLLGEEIIDIYAILKGGKGKQNRQQ